MWSCQKCHEEIEDVFDKCWNCGTSIEGVEDPTFKKEVPVEGNWQPIASGLVWFLGVLAILYGILGIYEAMTIEPWEVKSPVLTLLRASIAVSMMLGMSQALRLLLRIEQNTRSKKQSGTQ